MKCEWSYTKIKDILSYVVDNRGKTPPTQEFGYPLLEVNAVSATDKFPQYQVVRKYVSQETYDTKFRKGHPQVGDILIPTVGTLGAVSYVDKSNYCIAQNIVALRVNSSTCDSNFLYYILRNPTTKKRLLNLDIGGVQPSIKVPHLLELDILLPPLQEQKKIAAILSSFDNKIQLNNKINENLQQQARTLLTQWLIENDGTYEFSLLSEVAVINPDTYSPKDAWEFVNYLDTSSITDGIISEVQHIKPSTEKLPSRARRIIAANDVVFSTVRPNQQHFGIINDPLDHMLASTGFAVVRSNHPSVSNELLYLCLTESSFVEKMQQLAEQSTSTFPSIKPSDLGCCEIPFPISTDLAEVLKAAFARISINQKENRILAELRDTILPKLMNGEIDVDGI